MRTSGVTRELRHEGAGGLHGSARNASGESLTAGNLAALLRAAGLPCVTLTTEAAAVTEPASTAGEGLRIVADSFPVRVLYAVPPGSDAATQRRGSHLLWLAGFAEEHRWSTEWLAGGWMTVHPEPWPATYMHDGHEVFRATGRPVDEDLGTWAVLWIVHHPRAWADAIDAEVTREIQSAPKNRRKATYTYMQQQRLHAAVRIRDEGPRRTVRSVEYDQARADAHVAELYRAHPNPGVRYEAVPVTATATCTTCHCPMIQAGRWWHHTGGYPVACRRRKARSLPLEPGDWEISDMNMTCGYCGQCVSWPETQRSWVRLTGMHLLGVHRQTGELVVLAEVTGIAAPGEPGHLAHHCTEIPDSVRAEYAADIRAVTEGVTLQ